MGSEDLPLEQHQKKMKEGLQLIMDKGDLRGVAQAYIDANPHFVDRLHELIENGDTDGLKRFYKDLDEEVDELAQELLGA